MNTLTASDSEARPCVHGVGASAQRAAAGTAGSPSATGCPRPLAGAPNGSLISSVVVRAEAVGQISSSRSLNEAPLCAAAVAKLRMEGWRVVCEVPLFQRAIDAVALRDGIVMAIEAKVGFNDKLRRQLRYDDLAADYVLGVVGSMPKAAGVEWFKEQKIGLWVVTDQQIKVVVTCGPQNFNEYYRKTLIERMQLFDEDSAGGLPCLAGVGVAQEVQRGVDDYRAAHPKATWREIFANVPSHYATHQNMYSALRSNAERLAFRRRMKEKRTGNLTDAGPAVGQQAKSERRRKAPEREGADNDQVERSARSRKE
jgi:hypothetical protein